MDELNLYLSPAMLSRETSSTVLLKQAGMKQALATVVLTTLGDGTMLPPLLVLRVIGLIFKNGQESANEMLKYSPFCFIFIDSQVVT